MFKQMTAFEMRIGDWSSDVCSSDHWRITGQESTYVIIYHNPKCGTSRNTLDLIRNAGIEPHVIEYLKTPPARALLASLIARMGVPVRSILREKETAFRELGLGDPDLTDAQLPDAMTAHPTLMNPPLVVPPRGGRR